MAYCTEWIRVALLAYESSLCFHDCVLEQTLFSITIRNYWRELSNNADKPKYDKKIVALSY